MATLRQWLKLASIADKAKLRKHLKLSPQALNNVAARGLRTPAGTAGKLAKALARVDGSREEVVLPEVRREHLSAECRACDYAKRCAAMDRQAS